MKDRANYTMNEEQEQKGDFYFLNSYGKRTLLATNCTEQVGRRVMIDFLTQHNFKSYYTRIWEKDNEKWYDVGSHSEFFIFSLYVKKGE